jgi:hypothetical protein
MYGFKDAIDRNVNKKGHLCICSHDTVELLPVRSVGII